MAADQAALDPGYTFSPSDHDLITLFLRPKVAGQPIDARFNIHEADAYSAAPADLVKNRDHAPGTDKRGGKGGTWYFFSPARRYDTKRTGSAGGRRQRAVDAAGEGCSWHSEGGEQPVLDADGRRIGHLRKLSFGFKKSPGAPRTRLGWCMTEFGLDHHDSAGWVLCKVYKSPRAKASSTETGCAAGSKRKAADDQHPEAPHPQIVRQEMTDTDRGLLQEIERWLLSDDESMLAGVDDGVDPARFFAGVLDVEGGEQGRAEAAEDDGRFECTLDELLGVSSGEMDMACPARALAPAFVSCESQLHVAVECATADCNLCVAEMMQYLCS